MRVLQLGPYPPPEGGISRNMMAIADEVAARGGNCLIIATSRSSEIRKESDVYYPRTGFQLLKILASLDFDVLHLHIGGQVTPRVLLLAAAAGLFGKGRSVLTLHSGAYPQTPAALSARPFSVRGFLFRRFSRIISVNDQIADVFRRYGVDPGSIRVILPFALFPPNADIVIPTKLEEFRKMHSPFLLSVGGLEKEYGPIFQVAAMKKILAEFPNAGLMIAGGGSMRQEVEDAVNESGYAENISIAGNVDHAVALRLIADADVFLRTTLFDGDAISIREALFFGTPVVATENAMRPDGVETIAIGDGDAFIEKVTRICAAGRQPRNIGTADISNIGKVVDLYDELATL